jgi:hypothetical protein
MWRKVDPATFYYWRIEFIELADPDDDCYVMLHGDEGEVVGPITMQLAERWIDQPDGSPSPLTANSITNGNRMRAK